ncbi:hypothetical protein STAQ_27980 [Allostella sp. ATCC 35155]|nr:hypothetical protein STAQ_27980 [Stella sp. ATCC 35155]
MNLNGGRLCGSLRIRMPVATSETPTSNRSASHIAGRLRALRLSLGLSQAELCRRAGLAPNTWNQWEKASSQPDLQYGIRLVDAFRVTLDWIYLGDASGLPHALAVYLQDNPAVPVSVGAGTRPARKGKTSAVAPD